jgi:hypothetical protein
MSTYRKDEPTLEVTMTLSELRAVIKSLSIGVDQLSKKQMRQGDGGRRAESVYEEYELLLSAKAEMEDVLSAVLGEKP